MLMILRAIDPSPQLPAFNKLTDFLSEIVILIKITPEVRKFIAVITQNPNERYDFRYIYVFA